MLLSRAYLEAGETDVYTNGGDVYMYVCMYHIALHLGGATFMFFFEDAGVRDWRNTKNGALLGR